MKHKQHTVRHRLDDLEISVRRAYADVAVRHRLDDLEISPFHLVLGCTVRHRLDDLEKGSEPSG